MSTFQESKTIENSKRKRESDIIEEVPKRYKKCHEYIIQNDLVLDEEKLCKGFDDSISIQSNENEKIAMNYINDCENKLTIKDIIKTIEQEEHLKNVKAKVELYKKNKKEREEKTLKNNKNFIVASLQLMCLDYE
jgi:hypothetical protein